MNCRGNRIDKRERGDTGKRTEKTKNPQSVGEPSFEGYFLELLTRFELVTSSLPRMCSTT